MIGFRCTDKGKAARLHAQDNLNALAGVLNDACPKLLTLNLGPMQRSRMAVFPRNATSSLPMQSRVCSAFGR